MGRIDTLPRPNARMSMSEKKSPTAIEVVRMLESLNVMIYCNDPEKLDTLSLRDIKLTPRLIQSLEKLPSLKRLGFQGSGITDENLEQLSHVIDLEWLDLRSCKNITDKGMSYVSRMRNLKKLELYDTQLGDQSLEILSKLANLQELNIHSTQITDDGLRFLRGFTELVSLDLGGSSPVTDDGLKYLEPLRKLEWLQLSESQFSDYAFVHLRHLTQLDHLFIGWSTITGLGFKHLSKLSRLESLFAAESQFTDEGLRYLAPFKRLKDLNLCSTKVTDKGLKYLKGLSKLKTLSLDGTRVTKEAKSKLKEVLTRCVITISSEPPEEDLSNYDTEYFWNNPPRCISGFVTEAVRDQAPTTFRLTCRCGCQKGNLLGYPLSSFKPEFTGSEFVGPLAFRCTKCRNTTEIIDTKIHGYDGEIGSSATIRGKGKRASFQCGKCKTEEMGVTVHFQYDGGEMDLKDDDPSIDVQDFFGWFDAQGKCANCQEEFSIASIELA
jgi:hypothetical protein